MTKATQEGYAELWESELKKKCTSETAGEMASLMDAFLSSRNRIHGPRRPHQASRGLPAAHHATEVPSRGHRAGLRVPRACSKARSTLLEKLVKLGVKQHPRSALLNLRAGLLETERGPFNFGGPKARNYLETARKLAEARPSRRRPPCFPRSRARSRCSTR